MQNWKSSEWNSSNKIKKHTALTNGSQNLQFPWTARPSPAPLRCRALKKVRRRESRGRRRRRRQETAAVGVDVLARPPPSPLHRHQPMMMLMLLLRTSSFGPCHGVRTRISHHLCFIRYDDVVVVVLRNRVGGLLRVLLLHEWDTLWDCDVVSATKVLACYVLRVWFFIFYFKK